MRTNKPRRTNILAKISSDYDNSDEEESDDLGPNFELPEIPKSIDAISFFNNDTKFTNAKKPNKKENEEEKEEDLYLSKKSIQNLVNNR